MARLRKKLKDLKKSDKTPRNYDHRPFQLDGRMDLDLTFNGQTMCTPVYIKLDAHGCLSAVGDSTVPPCCTATEDRTTEESNEGS